MNDYWVVIEKSTGRVIAHCGEEEDAIMMVSFKPHHRTYTKQKFIMDQVIDVTSTVDKQLPGQQGLPAAKHPLPNFGEETYLPQGTQVPVNAK